MRRNEHFEDALASAFSHPGLGLVDILDSKKYQTEAKINSGPPRRDSQKLGVGKVPNGSHAP